MNGRTQGLRGVLAALALAAALLAWPIPGRAEDNARGKAVFGQVCIGCHQIGVLGAPKAGDTAAWKKRLAKGLDTLVQHALNGFGKMPPKGGNPNLVEADVRAAIHFMAGEALVVAAPKSAPPTAPVPAVAVATPERGADVVQQVCRGCHAIGVLGAPKIGNAEDWKPRVAQGEDTLVQHALSGKGNMPPRGGNAALTAAELRAAIRYMIDPPALPQPKQVARKPTPPPPPADPPAPAVQARADVNRFNRLLRPHTERNPPPAKDGIHDPANDGTNILQPPRVAFKSLPHGNAGNYVDWVKALKDGAIAPRWDLKDPSKQPLVMDLNIVREVKGSMPDVVYPHQQHLQWLDCSNCHPAIFIPKKGANQISMAEILLGRKCGVCHGKVAFPVSECRRCHSKKKSDVAKR